MPNPSATQEISKDRVILLKIEQDGSVVHTPTSVLSPVVMNEHRKKRYDLEDSVSDRILK